MGWLNPFLYAHPEAFNDITNGTNPGCSTDGFSATSGWDPVRIRLVRPVGKWKTDPCFVQVTGLGSPNYPKLKTAAGL